MVRLLTVLLCLGIAVPAAAQRFPFTWTVEIAETATLDVSTIQGAVEVSDGPAGQITIEGLASVRIGLTVPADAAAVARRVAARPPITSDSTKVVIALPTDPHALRAVTLSYRLRVPPTVRVRVQSQSGAINLRRIGQSTITSGSGQVRATASGPIAVTSRSGAVDLEAVAGTVRVAGGSGHVRVAMASSDPIEVRTRSGAIDVTGARGPLAIDTQSGEVHVAGHPDADWQVDTGSSQARLALDRAAICRVDATSRSGNIHVPDAMRGRIEKHRVLADFPPGGPVVRLTTRSGAIHVTR